MPSVKGCHLVGSVPFTDAEEVFKKCTSALPGRLSRLPDGETGLRSGFTYWQHFVFPELIRSEIKLNEESYSRAYTDQEVEEGMRQVREMGLHTGYDDEAIKSYAVFKKLKEEGVIEPEVKFQVCLPTVASTVGYSVAKPFQVLVEPIYQDALHRAIRNIQDTIPHQELAIQIDLAPDFFYLEGVWEKTFFSEDDHIANYTVRMANEIADGVDFGFHTCYGDMDHKHMIEPESLETIVVLMTKVMSRCRRPPTWIHCPVPLSAMGSLDTYFAPLIPMLPILQKGGTKLYLGLVHHDDLEGTKKRIEHAGKVVPEFGVATECGFGRTPPDQLKSIMEILSEVSSPVNGA